VDSFAELGVSRETIADFCRRWNIREFAIFGSAARGEIRADNPVEVMVEFEPGARPRGLKFMRPIIELEDLFGRPVELMEKGPIENPFRRKAILRDLKVLYAA
jgi:predicted nucleotidyltransferase